MQESKVKVMIVPKLDNKDTTNPELESNDQL